MDMFWCVCFKHTKGLVSTVELYYPFPGLKIVSQSLFEEKAVVCPLY